MWKKNNYLHNRLILKIGLYVLINEASDGFQFLCFGQQRFSVHSRWNDRVKNICPICCWDLDVDNYGWYENTSHEINTINSLDQLRFSPVLNKKTVSCPGGWSTNQSSSGYWNWFSRAKGSPPSGWRWRHYWRSHQTAAKDLYNKAVQFFQNGPYPLKNLLKVPLYECSSRSL